MSSTALDHLRRTMALRAASKAFLAELAGGPTATAAAAAAAATAAAADGATTDSRTDYEAAGRILLADARRLASSQPNASAVFSHATTGAVLYVGNAEAACDHEGLLRKYRIRHIVNCRAGRSKRLHVIERRGKTFTYFFAVEDYWRFVYDSASKRLLLEAGATSNNDKNAPRVRLDESDAGTLALFLPVLEWIWDRLERGHNVLCHCLVGAHRAGTTAVAFTLWRQWMGRRRADVFSALREVQQARPIVDPLGGFAKLLVRLEAALGGN